MKESEQEKEKKAIKEVFRTRSKREKEKKV